MSIKEAIRGANMLNARLQQVMQEHKRSPRHNPELDVALYLYHVERHAEVCGVTVSALLEAFNTMYGSMYLVVLKGSEGQ